MVITSPDKISQFISLEELRFTLHSEGCKMCSLGFQEGLSGCCVARGNPASKRMIIGEAPGKHEDSQSIPFVGPAGRFLDKIFSSVGFNINTDFYLTNIILCRPIAEKGSGKENYTPRKEQRNRCKPYLDAQINFINPRIIITIGKPATETILGTTSIRMGDYRGKLLTNIPGTHGALVFPMLHPAAILHAQSQPNIYQLYREQTWQDIQILHAIIDKENI